MVFETARQRRRRASAVIRRSKRVKRDLENAFEELMELHAADGARADGDDEDPTAPFTSGIGALDVAIQRALDRARALQEAGRKVALQAQSSDEFAPQEWDAVEAEPAAS